VVGVSFSRVIGQERPKNILLRALQGRHLHHAYFFTGPEGAGKEAMAIEFAKTIYCNSDAAKPCDQCSSCRRIGHFSHPDFLFFFPIPKGVSVDEEREILNSLTEEPYLRKKPWANPLLGIDRVRELRRVSVLKPLESHRVVVIAEADKMTAEAANALLKILEEPPPNMYLILTSSRPQAVLATIFSRCQEVRFGMLTDGQIETALITSQNITAGTAKLIARVAQGNYRRALEWLEEDLEERRGSVVDFLRACLRDPLTQMEFVEELLAKYDKRVIKDFLSLVLIWFRDVLVLRNGAGHNLAVADLLVNADHRETLEKFSGAFVDIGFDDIFSEVERSIELIDRNVQIQLILIVLLTRLQRHLVIKG
jgi:DNA polymerase III subunit delta'